MKLFALKITFIAFALSLAGCAAVQSLSDFFASDSGRDTVEGAMSSLPYGELLLSGVILAQNTYLGAQKIRNRKKAS